MATRAKDSAGHRSKRRSRIGKAIFGVALASAGLWQLGAHWEVVSLFLVKNKGAFAVISGMLVAGFTGMLVRSTNRLWIAGREQLRETQKATEAARISATAAQVSADTMRQSERAWLGYNTVVVQRVFSFPVEVSPNTVEMHNGYSFTVEWINSGRTPALFLILYADGLKVDGQSTAPPFTVPESPDEVQGTAIPGAPRRAAPCFIDDATVGLLAAGTARYFLYSTADYDTVFSSTERHHSEVCLEVTIPGTKSDGSPSFLFTQTGPQNTAT